ncbi:hypothetical protein ASG16_006415 [Brevibacillus sp. Leaf182]|nr:hypothetical protein ASG16_006415 [Brevibacillus sp. Leaf182]
MDHANSSGFQKNRSTIPVHRVWTVGKQMIAFAVFPDFRKFLSGFMESSKNLPNFSGICSRKATGFKQNFILLYSRKPESTKTLVL